MVHECGECNDDMSAGRIHGWFLQKARVAEFQNLDLQGWRWPYFCCFARVSLVWIQKIWLSYSDWWMCVMWQMMFECFLVKRAFMFPLWSDHWLCLLFRVIRSKGYLWPIIYYWITLIIYIHEHIWLSPSGASPRGMGVDPMTPRPGVQPPTLPISFYFFLFPFSFLIFSFKPIYIHFSFIYFHHLFIIFIQPFYEHTLIIFIHVFCFYFILFWPLTWHFYHWLLMMVNEIYWSCF